MKRGKVTSWEMTFPREYYYSKFSFNRYRGSGSAYCDLRFGAIAGHCDPRSGVIAVCCDPRSGETVVHSGRCVGLPHDEELKRD